MVRRPLDPVRPVFVNNRNGDTLGRVIKTYLPALRSEGGAPSNCRSLFVGAEVSTGLVLHATVLREPVKNQRLGRGSTTA